MKTAALGLWAALLAAPGGAFAQASAPPAQAGSGAASTADSGKPAPKLMDAARRHYDDAIQFFKEGRYDAARVEFEASFALSKEPDLLYNLSTTAEKQGQIADAIRYAERYLEAKPNAEDAGVIRERIARLRGQGLPDGTSATAVPPTTVPAPTPAPLPPATTGAAEGRTPLPRAPLALLGVGGVLLLGGIGAGAGALATERDLESRPIVSYPDLMDLQSRGNGLNLAAISLSVVGGAAVVAGGVWLGVSLARHRASTK